MGAEQGVPGMVHPAPEGGGKPMTGRCTAAAAEMAAK